MTTKKILSVLICLVMVLSFMPMAAFADDYICEHEQAHLNGQHTTECGYAEGVKCGHAHDNSCATACTHTCENSTEGCVLAKEAVCVHTSHYDTATKGTCYTACTHVHTEECTEDECKHIHTDECCRHDCATNGKCTPAVEAQCKHNHTDACYANCPHTKGTHEGCGYVAASPCTFVCNLGCTPASDDPAPVQFVNELSITLASNSATYDGNAHQPQIAAVKCGDVTLNSGDYYSPEFYRDDTPTNDFISAGTIRVRVWGNENSSYKYKYGDAYFTINNPTTPPVNPATTLTVTLSSASTTYNGSEQKPVIASVMFGDTTLTDSYTVQYLRGTAETQDFTSAGDITVKVIGNAGTDYAGKSGSASYTIAKKPLTVTAKAQEIQYGQSIKPAEYEQSGLITSPAHTLTVELVADTAKKTITPVVKSIVDNNAGNSVMGNYDIKPVSGALTVTPKTVSTPAIKLERTSYGYTGKEIKPAVSVYDGNTLIPATEYTVSYTNNVNAGTAYVTVTDNNANGNYNITQTQASFTIASNVKYNVVLGNGGCWYRDSYYGLGFRCDGPFDQFIGLTIDGHAVDKSYYVASEGSTNVGLYPQLLSLLGNGTHYITFHYTSGSATGVFYVGSTAINAVMTGDDSNAGLMALVMCLGVLSSVTILSVLRKKKSGAR